MLSIQRNSPRPLWFLIHKIDFSPQRARHSPGNAQYLGEDGQVGGLERVPAWTESIIDFSITEKYRGLAFPYRKLGAEFYLS